MKNLSTVVPGVVNVSHRAYSPPGPPSPVVRAWGVYLGEVLAPRLFNSYSEAHEWGLQFPVYNRRPVYLTVTVSSNYKEAVEND